MTILGTLLIVYQGEAVLNMVLLCGDLPTAQQTPGGVPGIAGVVMVRGVSNRQPEFEAAE